MAVVNCAGDGKLAEKLCSHLSSALSPDALLLNEDEIAIKPGVKTDAIRKLLEEFIRSNPDLASYSITELGDMFTIGMPQSLDKVILSCEMCGYLANHEDELNIHKRTHGLLFLP
jgi:hypothetical protein